MAAFLRKFLYVTKLIGGGGAGGSFRGRGKKVGVPVLGSLEG